MPKLYSYKGAYPYPLPLDMTKYDLSDFILAGPTPSKLPGQVLEWTENNWYVRNPNESELQIKWTFIRTMRDLLLKESDVFVVRAYEKGEAVPKETLDYRQALRDVTKQANPFDIVWPTAPENPF